MAKPKRSYADKLHLDMPFDEAVERFAGTDAREIDAAIKRAKTKKPPGGKKAKPSGGKVVRKKTVRLRKRAAR